MSPAPPPIPPKPIGMTGAPTFSNSLIQKGNGNTQNLSDLNNGYNGNPIPQVPKLPPKKLPLNSFDDVTYSADVPTSSTIKYHRLIDSYHSTSIEDKEDEEYCMLDNSIEFESKEELLRHIAALVLLLAFMELYFLTVRIAPNSPFLVYINM